MKRRLLAMVILSITMLLMTGCWNNRDLTEMAILTGLGIDLTEDENIMITAQIIKPGAVKFSGSEGAGGGGDGKPFVVVSNSADTMFGAIRGMLAKVDNKIFYSTAQVIVIGDKAARNGIADLIDFLIRDHETQYKINVIVSKGTAREIIEQEYELESIAGAFIADTIENTVSRGFIKQTMLIDMIKEISSGVRQLGLGVIKIEGKTTSSEGTAVFLKDKLVGYLDKFETRGYLFAIGKIASTIIEIQNPVVPNKLVGVETLRSKPKLDMEWGQDGKPIFTVKITVEANIGEQHESGGISQKEMMDKAAEVCNQKVRDEVERVIRKCQEEYKSDIFGFGELIHKSNPSYWNEVKKDWNESIFPKTAVNVIVQTKLLRSGLVKEPLKID